MSELKKFTVHLHATYTPTVEMDGGKIAVVMGEPDVTECDCRPAPGSTSAHQINATTCLPWATFQNSGSDEGDDRVEVSRGCIEGVCAEVSEIHDQLKEMRNPVKEEA